MTRIIIKNVGPIINVELELKKLNVIIGPQSSGKSTIAKIVSYCSWYEKHALLDTHKNVDFLEELIKFHNLNKGYFNNKSHIKYESDYSSISYHFNKKVQFKSKIGIDNLFRNKKIIYIPSERNFAASIPNLGKYIESRNNILNFLYDWFDAKKEYSRGLNILNLNVKYHYDEENDSDLIAVKDVRIPLQSSSSGLQSLIPLIVLLENVLSRIYERKRTISPLEVVNYKEKLDNFKSLSELDSRLGESLMDAITKFTQTLDVSKQLHKEFQEYKPLDIYFDDLYKSYDNLNLSFGIDSNYNFSQVVLEEPEQNLFPTTQRDLVYYLLDKIYNNKRNHQLFITTHSPYILYALNNCMLGGLVQENIPGAIKKRLHKHCWISPMSVMVSKIEDGAVTSIQDNNFLIGRNYFDEDMKVVMDDYSNLMNFYKND